MARHRIVRRMGTQEPGLEKPWTCRALVVMGSRKAWVIASGETHTEASERLALLIEKQVADWETRPDG